MTKSRLAAILGAVALLSAGTAYFFSERAPVIEQIGLVGMPAPAWKLPDLDGREVSSDQFKGKVVVVDFWATWCTPCLMEIPGYIELQKKYGPQGLVIVGISLDRAKPEYVKKFAQELGINYLVVMDPDSGAAEDFGGVEAIPATFLINREGRILHQKTGPMAAEEYEKLVRWALK